MVSLGEKNPTWGVSRWGGRGLRFVPPDDEGFSVRGDKQRLEYKGRRRSHRFTILGDSAFEYDVILNREPESNVIRLRMEGAENFDFFRQPDFVPDPFLKGSYAVYKKEILLGEGTGKLCHIHRPLIIDARGRRVWGELSVVGNELRISIPEQWLGEAKYPVIVDPTVGTTQIGSLTHWDNVDNESYDQLFMEIGGYVNRFLIPETLNGLLTAYVYAYEPDYEGPCIPVLYSDNNNVPLTRRSANEGQIDGAVNSNKPAGWRSTTLNTNTSIASGNYIWYGLFCWWFAVRFDFGAKSYFGDWMKHYYNIPETYTHYGANWFSNFKISMYFTYSSAQNYIRTLTQGVRLTDSRNLKADYKRSQLQTVSTSDTRKTVADYKRSTFDNVNGAGIVESFVSLIRQCLQNVGNTMSLARMPVFLRSANEKIGAASNIFNNCGLSRKFEDVANSIDETKRSQGFFRNIYDNLIGTENIFFPVLFVRSISETQGITDTIQKWGAYIRGLYFEAGSLAEPVRRGDYYRFEKDIVQVEGSVLRHLLIFVRILTTSIVRDFFLRRFLIAREELVLKSCITREITLESKIN